MTRSFTVRSGATLATALVLLALAISACSSEPAPTSTPRPSPTPFVTPTLTPDARAKAEVSALLKTQVEAINRGDWAAVYLTCSPGFRSSRIEPVFIRDSIAQFARDGYRAGGFEARNIEPSVRAPERVRVRWDAYQDGEYVRSNEVGQVYVLAQGRWYDDGAWCR